MREDLELSVKFIQLIQARRCLYDPEDRGYCNKATLDAAWGEVGAEVGETIESCKERWKNMRGSLTRCLKQLSNSSTKHKKRYYLFEHLEFLIPYTKSKTQTVTNNTFMPSSSSSDTQDETLYYDYVDLQDDDKQFDPLNTPKRLKMGSETEQTPLEKSDLTTTPEDSDLDPDLCFFQCLLPDVHQMSPVQKRQMRLGVLQLIDDILTQRRQ